MRRKIPQEAIPGIRGLLTVHHIPFETEEEFAYWWLPERDSQGRVIRAPRLSKREKEHYAQSQYTNTLTTGGRGVFLAQLGSSSAPPIFAAYFALGSGFCPSTSSQDTALVSEFFRKQSSGYVVTGAQVDISIFLASAEGNGTSTNAGFYGGAGATSTLGTGTLCTHSLFQNNKASIPITIDYTLVQN